MTRRTLEQIRRLALARQPDGDHGRQDADEHEAQHRGRDLVGLAHRRVGDAATLRG